ncbi:PilN domain-containing protein [Candidatus Omnitrophota bacterium]
MPQINLLSPTIGKKLKQQKVKRKKERASFTKAVPVVYGVCAFVVVVLICIWVGLSFTVNKKEAAFAVLKEQESKLAVDPKYLAEIREKRDNLKKRVEFLESLSAKDFLWSQKLDRIADLIPDGVWLTKISFDKRLVTIDDDSGEKEERLKISIKGSAVAFKIQGAVELVGHFYKRIKEDEVFSKEFLDVKLDKISKSVVHGRDIMKFAIDCEIQ